MALKNAICENCEKYFTYCDAQKRGRFCSNKCNGEHHRNVRSRQKFEAGALIERDVIKRYVAERDGDCCSECNIGSEWNGKLLVFVLDHIDGDPANNKPENLRLLCPNCNSQTPTFSGRNRGFGRKSRGIPRF